MRDIRAAEVDPEEVGWLLDQPRIPLRGITIVVGFRGQMKTTFACWLAAAVTRLGENVLYVTSPENDVASFVRPRMEVASADLDRVFFAHEDEEWLRFPADVAKLAAQIQKRETRLVVLDPLSMFLPGFASATNVQEALAPLGRISHQFDCAICFIHHFRKSGGKNVAEAMGGSGALSDVARAVYVFGALPKPVNGVATALFGTPDWQAELEEQHPDIDAADGLALACEKLSAAEMPSSLLFSIEHGDATGIGSSVPFVEHIGTTGLSAEGLLGGYMDTRRSAASDDHSAVEVALQFLQELLLDGAQPSKVIQSAARDAGVSWRSCERAKQALRVIAFREGDRWWWKLPPTPDTLPEEWTA